MIGRQTPRICWPKMGQLLGQFGPGLGPFWASLRNPLKSPRYSILQWRSSKNGEKLIPFKGLGPMQLLLRQVCAFCEPTGEHPKETSSETLLARPASASLRPAQVASERRAQAVFRRPADCWMPIISSLALVFCIVGLPVSAADLWSHGSSFSASEGGANWVRTGFAPPEKSRKGEKKKSAAREDLPFVPVPEATPIANLRNLIAHAEAGAGEYDAVQVGASVRPAVLPTSMTLDEIRAWVAASPGQPHAIGRYQFIPATFERLAGSTALSGDVIFDPELQDRWANVLILEAGYADFVSGRLTPDAFMDNLAAVWAGLPVASGLSAYDGIAGNHATISRAAYTRALTAIFPAQSALASASR